MKNKTEIKFLVIIFVLSFFIQLNPAEAQGAFLYSVRAQTTPSNNGLEDYKDAESIIISNGLFTREIYIKNSESSLYIALRVEINETIQGLALVFDVDHDQQYADDVKILMDNQTKLDGYFFQKSALSLQSSNYFTGIVSTVSYIDGGSYRLYQFFIDFTPSNPATDLFIPDPSDYMLGFDFIEMTSIGYTSWSRGALDSENTLQKLSSNASLFYTLILAGPGKFAGPDFNPVVTTYTTQAPATSSTNDYENREYQASAATPGFEMIVLIGTMTLVLTGKKLLARRTQK